MNIDYGEQPTDTRIAHAIYKRMHEGYTADLTGFHLTKEQWEFVQETAASLYEDSQELVRLAIDERGWDRRSPAEIAREFHDNDWFWNELQATFELWAKGETDSANLTRMRNIWAACERGDFERAIGYLKGLGEIA